MKFGLFYLFSDFGDIPQDQLFEEVMEEIEHGEALGFDSVWLPEHHFAIYGMLGNPLLLAAAVAQRTTTMKIGTTVVVLPFQHPLRATDQDNTKIAIYGPVLFGHGFLSRLIMRYGSTVRVGSMPYGGTTGGRADT